MARKIIAFLLLFSMCFPFKSIARRGRVSRSQQVKSPSSLSLLPFFNPIRQESWGGNGSPLRLSCVVDPPKAIIREETEKAKSKTTICSAAAGTLAFPTKWVGFFVRVKNYKCRTPRGGADGSRRSGFAEKTHFRFYKAYLLTSSCPR